MCSPRSHPVSGGGGPTPRALPAGGAIDRGCDGGTAAVVSLAVGTRWVTVADVTARGEGVGAEVWAGGFHVGHCGRDVVTR